MKFWLYWSGYLLFLKFHAFYNAYLILSTTFLIFFLSELSFGKFLFFEMNSKIKCENWKLPYISLNE